MISAAPMKPGCEPFAGCGYSPNTPTVPANSFPNSASAGSSGSATSRQRGLGTSAASRMPLATSSPAGCWADIRSSSSFTTTDSCSIGSKKSSMWDVSLTSPRKL